MVLRLNRNRFKGALTENAGHGIDEFNNSPWGPSQRIAKIGLALRSYTNNVAFRVDITVTIMSIIYELFIHGYFLPDDEDASGNSEFIFAYTNAEMLKFDNDVLSINQSLLINKNDTDQEPPPTSKVIYNFCYSSGEGKENIIYSVFAYKFYEKFRYYITSKDFEEYYIPKAFCIISQYAFFTLFNYICKNLFIIMTKELYESLPFELIIYNIVNFIPSPISYGLHLNLFGNFLKVPDYEINQLSGYFYLDFDLSQIFNLLPLNLVIEIFILTFIEKKIVFFSKNLEILNMTMFIMYALNYPCNDGRYFSYIVSFPPKKLTEENKLIGEMYNYMVGVNDSYSDDIDTSEIGPLYLIVDIDNKIVTLHNEDEDNKLPEFPKNNKKNLEKKLQDVINKYLKEAKIINSKKKFIRNSTMIVGQKNFPTQSFSISSNDTTIDSKSIPVQGVQIPDESMFEDENEKSDEIKGLLSNLNIDYSFNQELNEIFFNFNANLLSNYNSSLNRSFYSSNETPSLDTLFKVQDFLKKVPSNDKNFYDKFVSETQIFGDFLYLRMIPKNTKEKIRILLFDEKINENSKNCSKVFTETKEYDFVDTHSPQKPRSLTKEEIDFYKDAKNQKELLKYGIIVSTDKKDENKVVFNYPIFPKLTNLLFLTENIKEYFPPENWNDNLDQINEDLISRSHLGDVSIRLDGDMKKYIYLCWMQMWALTFWYSKENEKKYWFQELLKTIEKSSCYEMEIFNLLFEALSKYGRENMVLRLYSILLKRRLNPSFKVHNIVMKILEKKKESGNFGDILQKIIEKDEKSSANILTKNNFSKRTFRSKYYPNILTENINFYAFETCIFCQKDINLELASKNLKAMNRDLNWMNCPQCHEPILPKLTVQFGEEINKNGDFKTNTCKYDTVVLFSPYVLKNNYNSYFPRNIGVKLDVDELMMKYSSIFWNSLWYFKLNGLEYDFMQPYYYRLEAVKPYKELKVTLIEQGKNDSDDEDGKQPFEVNKFKIVNNSFTLK